MYYYQAQKASIAEMSKTFSVDMVDEAKHLSIVTMVLKGQFIRSGKPFSTTQTIMMKWKFGRVAAFWVIDNDLKTILEAYRTVPGLSYCFFL